ncbi:unnamed protein product [Medioppia subpectinata]|uniref:AAA+ ATPase domain-containing protein n=1 Tax=Medioppia subpectinata TaxID=1979941 RepID=A0A7R9Q036_9ACAR|nr:unnamed protein product [Medioppia subpectinata]CAG2107702.1 unnamed protein product [Medioppia subpectinata]
MSEINTHLTHDLSSLSLKASTPNTTDESTNGPNSETNSRSRSGRKKKSQTSETTNGLANDLPSPSLNASTPKTGDHLRAEPNSESKSQPRSQRKKKGQTNGVVVRQISLSHIMGYEPQMNALRELIETPLSKSHQMRQMSAVLPKSVLLFGPTGCGKSSAVKAFCAHFNQQMFCVHINCATILAKSFATSEDNLRTIFTNAIEMSPSLVCLDNFEMISSAKKSSADQEKRLTAILCAILDDLPIDKHIVMVAVTNKPDLIDTSLRRPGRLDREIEFAVPLPKERTAILRKHLSEMNSDISDEVLSGLAQSAHSFTGADLALSCRESALIALKDNRHVINENDLKQTLKSIRPSAMREISLEVPNVFWTDIGGMHGVRNKLIQSVVWPLTNPEAFTRLAINAPKGVLMYGPPGCCKTMIGKALATESGLNFLAIKGPELFNKWVGESERAVREVFRKARAASPSILFFDEIDALAAERGVGQSTVGDRVLAQLLTEIDGIEQLNGVVIVAATNRPDMIDKALLRPGRLDSILYVPLPDMETRYEILRIRTRKMPLNFEQPVDEILKQLAVNTEGYTGAEITGVCQEAGLIALEGDINCQFVELKHFESALESIKPRISRQMIAFYENYKNETTNNPINKT